MPGTGHDATGLGHQEGLFVSFFPSGKPSAARLHGGCAAPQGDSGALPSSSPSSSCRPGTARSRRAPAAGRGRPGPGPGAGGGGGRGGARLGWAGLGSARPSPGPASLRARSRRCSRQDDRRPAPGLLLHGAEGGPGQKGQMDIPPPRVAPAHASCFFGFFFFNV